MNVDRKKFISSKEFYNLPINELVNVINRLQMNKQISGIKTLLKKRNEEFISELFSSTELFVEDEVYHLVIDSLRNKDISDKKIESLINKVTELGVPEIDFLIIDLLSSKRYELLKTIFSHKNLRTRSKSIPEEKRNEYLSRYLFKEEHKELLFFLVDKNEITDNILIDVSTFYRQDFKDLLIICKKEKEIAKKVKDF